MTNEEEKILEEILDEENDITLEEAAEEAEDLQEETQDEVKEVREEIPDDVRLDPDEIRERPVMREGGLRDAADPNMIQKHLDNFLAKIAGETPVDDKPRNSTEYWLNKIAESGGGGETKLYMHIIRFRASNTTQNEGLCSVVTKDETPYTLSTFCDWLHENGIEGSTSTSDKVLPATGLAYGTSPAGAVMGVYKRNGETQLIVEVITNQFEIARLVNPSFVSDTVISIN